MGNALNCQPEYHTMTSSKSKRRPEAAFNEVSDDNNQHIWLAGLGAFAKAQAEGGKAFETLVAEGLEMQRRSQSLAQQHMTDVAQRLGEMTARAGQAATGPRDKLGGIFEDRVARALSKLGVPGLDDWQALVQRIEALETQLASARRDASSATKSPSSGQVKSKPRAKPQQ